MRIISYFALFKWYLLGILNAFGTIVSWYVYWLLSMNALIISYNFIIIRLYFNMAAEARRPAPFIVKVT